MRTTARRLVAAAALTLVTLTGCAEDDPQDALDQAQDEASSALEDAELDTELPDVDLPSTDLPEVDLPNLDLDQYSADFQERLEELTANADCDGLQQELDNVEGDSELTRYLETQLEQLNC